MLNVEVRAVMNIEPRMVLKTISVVMRPIVTGRLDGPSGSGPPRIA
jgi:hypothetical protein